MKSPAGVAEVSNQEKESVWTAYRDRKPTRVPVALGTNPRVIILSPSLNKRGYTFEQVFNDPTAMFEIALDHEYYRRTVINNFCDDPVGLPDEWEVGVNWQNVFEAVFFGAEIDYKDDQVPDTPPFLQGDDREQIFDVDIDHPLDHGIFKKGLEFYERMCELAQGYEFHGRPVKVAPYSQAHTDGPLTVATNVRSGEIFSDLLVDPDYAFRLLDFITEAAIKRVYAFRKYYGDDELGAGLADDSIQLISTDTYREVIMPHHRRYYDEFAPDQPRGIHLCGDVMRHMPTLVDELNIQSWDTGYPVDFGWVRRELGTEIEIYGGPRVMLLLQGTPQEVYDETCRILESGIMTGGRFVLREANNLPPCVPEANLAAMYRASLDKGWH